MATVQATIPVCCVADTFAALIDLVEDIASMTSDAVIKIDGVERTPTEARSDLSGSLTAVPNLVVIAVEGDSDGAVIVTIEADT